MKALRIFTVYLLTASCSIGASAARLDLPAPICDEQTLGRSENDPRVRRYVIPKRIVWESGEDTVENPSALLKKRTGQVTLKASEPCILKSGQTGGGILLDFGVELQGGVQIMVWHTKNNKPVRLRVRFGESVSEAMAEFGGEKNTTNDHAIRDQSILVPWLGTGEIGNTGFRFVRIDIENEGSFVQLKAVRAIFIYRDLEYKGSFKCSDERLNRIWNVGAYTVHLNMQDYLWDGIKRDRLVWVGDMHPETMTIWAVFGDNDIIGESLDLIREETPLPGWMNGIGSYSMWWVLIHHQRYIFTGDKSYLKEQKEYLTGLLAELCKHVGEDNREKVPGHRFLDWPSSENKDAIHAGLHSLLVMTLEAGAELCEILDESATRKKCLKAVAKLKKHIPDPANSKQAAALIALAGLDDAGKLNREVMAVDGARRMSTFYGYYVLQARAMAGDYQGALDCIREYWGAMLDLGATTFWEDFDLDWTKNAGRIDEPVPAGMKDIHGDFGNYCYKGFRHSLCHGWASGPTAWLSEHVLGVKVLEPGCSVVKIEPHLGDLDWVEGTFPTPKGVIKIRHDKTTGGKILTKIDPPKGIRIIREE
ncbi:MAG: alpha-L-rhamnosidase-related protein [Planctomycetota bacterium]|jgi:hypothetical protein